MAWEITRTIKARRLLNDWLVQAKFENPAYGFSTVEVEHVNHEPSEADLTAWEGRITNQLDKAWGVYQDALGRIGTVINVGDWRCRLEGATPQVQPPQITLRCLVFHPDLKIGGEAEYVVDSLDDYSLPRLQAWLTEWVEGFAARFTADKARTDQEVLDEAMGEAR